MAGSGFSVFAEGGQGGGVEFGDAAVGADDEGEGEGVPVAVVEGLPGFSVVAADIGAVGAGGDPEIEGVGVLDGGAEAVGRGGGGEPGIAAIDRPRGCAGGFVGLSVIAADGDNATPISVANGKAARTSRAIA